MRRFELVRDPDNGRVTATWEAEERLTAAQRFSLWAMAIGGAVLVALACLVGVWALILAGGLGFIWMMCKVM